MFKDISDPASIVLLRSGEIWNDDLGEITANDHFEEVLGQGVRLKRINVEVIDEPVSTGISQLITWLPDYYDEKFDGRKINSIKAKNRLVNSMSSGAFSTEVRK